MAHMMSSPTLKCRPALMCLP